MPVCRTYVLTYRSSTVVGGISPEAIMEPLEALNARNQPLPTHMRSFVRATGLTGHVASYRMCGSPTSANSPWNGSSFEANVHAKCPDHWRCQAGLSLWELSSPKSTISILDFELAKHVPLDLVAETEAMTDPNPTLDEILPSLLDAQ